MNNESLVEKLRRIGQEKEKEHKKLIHEREREIHIQETLATEVQTKGMDHASHFRIANPTPLQVHFPNSFLDYDSGRRIETTLHNSTHIKSDVKKWLCFLREQGISKPQADLEIVVLIDSKDEENLLFFKIEINKNLSTIIHYRADYTIGCFRFLETQLV